MAGKAIIYISNQALIIYRWYGKKLAEDLRLENTDQATLKLTEYFQSHANKPIKVVFDILEEMYSLESLPHLNSRDRKAMITRKQRQMFAGLNFIYTDYKGRSDTERRDDLVLFSAITEEKSVNRWLQSLFEAKVRVSGLYSLPVLMEFFAQQLQGKQYKLLISISRTKQGILLRQSFFNNNILALSRFKQINEADQQALAAEIKEDVNRSERFIARHFNITNTDNLAVYFFASGKMGKVLFEQIDFSDIRIRPTLLLTNDFAQAQGYEIDSHESLPAYISGLAAKKRGLPSHYHEPKSHFYYFHYVVKVVLNSCSALIVLVTLAYSFTQIMSTSSLYDQEDDLRKQRNTILKKLTMTQTPPLFKSFNPFELAEQIKLYQQLKNASLSPDKLLNAISLALENSPKIILTKLEWGKQSEQGIQQQTDGFMDPSAMDNEVVAEPVIETVPISLQAKVSGFDGSYRHILVMIEQFKMRLLDNQKILNVQTVKLPIDISADNETSGAIKSQDKKTDFILEIQWQRNNG